MRGRHRRPGNVKAQAVGNISGLAAGETAEVTLRLPQAALKMVVHGQAVAFNQFGIVVDVDGKVLESDKANNAVVVGRSTLEAAE